MPLQTRHHKYAEPHNGTARGFARASARINGTLAPAVGCGQHGWWQACPELGLPGFGAFDEDGANYNLLIGNAASDPVSGSVPHRAWLCEVTRIT